MTHEHPSNRRLGGPAIAGLACMALLAACSKSPTPAPVAPEAAAAAPAVAPADAPVAATEATPMPTAAPADASALAPSASPEAMTPAALEELLAPIALYPDSLLGVLLSSATHPQEVMDGGNWLLQQKATGVALDAEAQQAGFGPSVRALLQFPTVVDMMCQNFDWTQQLGSASPPTSPVRSPCSLSSSSATSSRTSRTLSPKSRISSSMPAMPALSAR